MVNDSIIPVSALGFQYYRGPVVTVLSSKSSSKLLSIVFISFIEHSNGCAGIITGRIVVAIPLERGIYV